MSNRGLKMENPALPAGVMNYIDREEERWCKYKGLFGGSDSDRMV